MNKLDLFDAQYEVVEKKRTGKLYYDSGWSENLIGKVAATIKDTGNGYLIKFNSANPCNDDKYVSLSYSEAEEMYLLLKMVVSQ